MSRTRAPWPAALLPLALLACSDGEVSDTGDAQINDAKAAARDARPGLLPDGAFAPCCPIDEPSGPLCWTIGGVSQGGLCRKVCDSPPRHSTSCVDSANCPAIDSACTTR